MKRQQLLRQSQVRVCRGNAPVLLDNPDSVYWVAEGEVQIFLLDPTGERWPWLHLSQDGWLRGQLPVEGTRLAAYASSSEGSQVAVSAYQDLAEFGDFFLASLEELYAQFGTTLAPAVPKDTLSLKAGERAYLMFEGDRCNAEQGLVWVRASEGQLHLLEKDGPLLPEQQWFPLHRSIWAYADQRVRLESAATEQVGLGADWIAGVSLLQTRAFLRARHECQLRREALVEAVARRQSADDAALSRSLASIAQILPGSQVLLPQEEAVGEDLKGLCGLLEEAYGCAFPPKIPKDLPLPLALAQAARCRWRIVLLRKDWWRGEGGPMLAFLEGKAGVLRCFSDHYVFQAASGTSQRVTAQLAEQFNPRAYVFYPPFPQQSLSLLRLAGICLQLGRRELLVLLVVGILTGLLAMITPVATGLLIGTVLPTDLKSELVQLVLALLVATLASNFFGIVRALTLLRLEGLLDSHLQAALFDRLLDLPVPFFQRYSLGDLANRAMGFNAIRQALSGAVLSSLLGAIFSVFSFALLFYYSWHLALVACGIVFFQCLLLAVGGVLQLGYQRVQMDLAGKLAGRVAQFLSGITKIRVAGAEARAFYQWSELFARYRKSAYRLRVVNLILGSFQGLIGLLSHAVLLGFTAHFGFTKAISAAALMSFFSAFGQFSSGLASITNSLTGLLSVGPILARARPILEEVPEVLPDMPQPAPLRGHVEVKGAWFRYTEQSSWVLEDVSLEARPGEFIAIVGPSGAGKSSLLRLLLGFADAQRGTVLYDDQNLQRVDRQALRRQLGVVLQDARLMPGSLLSNIVGSSQLGEEEAWQALRLAGLEREVQEMPMQLHTVVTDGGGGLSGGQRQRLMIARAVVAQPRVLIFDEATSALDAKVQEEVSRSLANLQATRIVVAHRLSTVRKADRIYVIHQHRIVQVGTFEELASQPGFFAEFARRQLA